MTQTPFHYCAGCTHGVVHRMIADVLSKLTLRENVIGIAPVGCAVFAYNYFNFDMQEAAHGRAPAVATGIKRVLPEKIVFAYQGDGDLASIGLAEITHAAARGENVTVIFVNNGVYGMTGGQMAPTTLEGVRTTTSKSGRKAAESGYPIRVCEMLATLDGPAYIARVSCHDAMHTAAAEKAIEKAFVAQIQNKGFSLVEVLAICPTNFHTTAVELLSDQQATLQYYPLGEFTNRKVT